MCHLLLGTGFRSALSVLLSRIRAFFERHARLYSIGNNNSALRAEPLRILILKLSSCKYRLFSWHLVARGIPYRALRAMDFLIHSAFRREASSTILLWSQRARQQLLVRELRLRGSYRPSFLFVQFQSNKAPNINIRRKVDLRS